MKNPELTTDVFTFPNNGKHIIYAPFRHTMILTNEATVNLLADIKAGTFEWTDDAEQHKMIAFLREKGILDSKPDRIPKPPNTTSFEPTAVTLFPTNQCNMRCIYCYASAGEAPPQFMPWKIARAAIDLVAENAKKLNVKHFSVGFHGGGEPTLDWNLFTKCVEYSKKVSDHIGIKVLNSVATNAVFNQKQIDWILKNLHSMSVSLDGPADVQNVQRPLANGKPSFDIVHRNIKALDAAGFSYGVRSTITNYNVNRMSEIVRYFIENYKTKQIQFEPLFLCGRCHTSNIDAPDYATFMTEFLKANEIADAHKVKLAYSGLRLGGVTSTFCGACGSNFSVTPEGDVTSCFEVSDRKDPRSPVFFFGQWNDKNNSFETRTDKLDYLRSFNVQNISYCQDCIAKWHCAGDCLAKVAYDQDLEGDRGSTRCQLNQEITKQRIMQLFRNPPAGKTNQKKEVQLESV